ncbi:RNA-binding protein 34-like [Uranotaenia lowii]|uniref:RNA-binding protein 34-like n=1 Tax=Uranotaenia lowii TaxID=190385 RepID=UPI002478C8E8|nr:RNA-binding protein 34-like [Uranotaenia lowii]
MGKKSKDSKKKQHNEDSACLVGPVENTLLKLSKKSKKIKKNKQPVKTTDSKTLEKALPENVVENAAEPKVKKSKKKKNKVLALSQENKESITESIENVPDVLLSEKSRKKILPADEAVVTSESESYSETENEKETKGQEPPKEKRFTGPEHSIFIGNLPNTAKKSSMKALFKPYGRILTIRFRTNDGVAMFKKKDRKEAKALNCYVRFETKEMAEAACFENGKLVDGNRIRVMLHSQKQYGHANSTVFVGNINRKTTDNELYDFFSSVGELEYVRQIADRGIGYVCFKKGVSIAKALKLNQQLLNGRPLRIMKVDPNHQSQRRNKKGHLVSKNRLPPSAGGNSKKSIQQKVSSDKKSVPNPDNFHGTLSKDKNGKKQKDKKFSISEKKKKLLARKLTAAGTPRTTL